MKKIFNRAKYILGLVAWLLIPAALVLATYNLTAWTEVDAGNHLTVYTDSVYVYNLDHPHANMLYYDFGEDYLDSGYQLDFTMNFAAEADYAMKDGAQIAFAGMSENLTYWYNGKPQAGKAVAVRFAKSHSPNYWKVYLSTGNTTDTATSATLYLGASYTYYARVLFNDTGGTYGFGTYTLYVYSNAARTTLVGSASIAAPWVHSMRYMYAVQQDRNSAYGAGTSYFTGTFGSFEYYDVVTPTITTADGSECVVVYDGWLGYYYTTLTGTVTNDGGGNVTGNFWYGLTSDNFSEWSYANAIGSYNSGDNFTATIYNLTLGENYSYFAQGTNSYATDNGSTENFTVAIALGAPSISTLAYPIYLSADNATADIYGFVDSDGGENTTGYFLYRLASAENWTQTADQTGLVTGDTFTVELSGLDTDVIYQFMAGGYNSSDNVTGAVVEFLLEYLDAPILETLPATLVRSTSAYLNAHITHDGGQSSGVIQYFRYRVVGQTEWTTSQYKYPNEGDNVSTSVTLTPLTPYEYQAVAFVGTAPFAKTGYGLLVGFSTMAASQPPVMLTQTGEYLTGGLMALDAKVYYDGGSAVNVWTRYKIKDTPTWSTTLVSYGAVTGDIVTTFAPDILESTEYVYQAVGVNDWEVPTYGAEMYFYIDSEGVVITDPDEPTDPTGNPIIDWANTWLDGYGLDNVLGHWLILAIVELLVALIFLVFLVMTPEPTIKKVIAMVWAIIAIAVIGAALFSGFLGIISVIVLVFVAVGLLVVFGGRLLEKGRA